MRNKGIIIILVVIVFIVFLLIAEQKTNVNAEKVDGDKVSIIESEEVEIANNLKDVKKYFLSQKNINIPILLYHDFAEGYIEEEKYYLITTPEKFEENIITILKDGYKIISLDDAIQYSRNKRAIPEKSVVITFDDGYISNYELIYTILKKYNVPVTIFIVTNSTKLSNHFDYEKAKEMEKSGLVSIYSHSANHYDSVDLNSEAFAEDIIKAQNDIIKNLGSRKYKVFCYPGGVYDNVTNQTLKDYNYDAIMTTIDGINTIKDFENKMLKRRYVMYNYSKEDIQELLK